MKVLLFLIALSVSSSPFAQLAEDRQPQSKEEERAFEEWNEEEEEARERAERFRRVHEERARGYQPLQEDYMELECVDCPPAD